MQSQRPARAFGALVATAVLDDLLAGLDGDVAILLRFIDDFVGLWSRRVARLRTAIAEDDSAEAIAALESIRVSSTMLGAVGLAATAESARRSIVDGGALTAVPVAEIARLGQRSGDALLDWSRLVRRRASVPRR
ncbi:MAG: hypothetical protein ABWY36_08820 [Leifsonia sp.]